jgi:DNA polymerase-3 subunit gamma/tau
LGYRPEQRFHFELGLLKMAHAQRLLPIEQLLSEVAASNEPRRAAKPAMVPETRKPESPTGPRSGVVSPFAADSARKSGSKQELSPEGNPSSSRIVAAATPAVVMGSAALAAVAQPAPETQPATENDAQPTDLRIAVLDALAKAGHRMLGSMLETGEWKVNGSELLIKVGSSATVIDMSLGADAKRLAVATASGVIGRPMKLAVVPGGTPQSPARVRSTSNGGGRSRAEQDPVVRRMQEKFGAEIRTIIDYKERR